MKELRDENAEEFRDVAMEYALKAGYDGKAIAYALMAVAAELDLMNAILDEIRGEGIG